MSLARNMSNIKVAVRVRPLNQKETDRNDSIIVDVNGEVLSIKNVKVESICDFGDSRERIKHFTFDYCYNSFLNVQNPNYASQEVVFQDLGTEVLQAAIEGYNASVFAYGQTGSGKTYTMTGTQDEVGLIPRLCEGLFGIVDENQDNEDVSIRVDISYMEIYNERVRDLLQPGLMKQNDRYTLRVREHPKDGPQVQDLSWNLVKNNEEIQALLERGNECRSTAATYMHESSSRSHAIVTILFTQAKIIDNLPSEIISKIHLIDLAGSERADPTTINYKGRLKEGANINKSLVTLGNVIKGLAEQSLLAWSTENMGSNQSVQSMTTGDTSSSGGSPKRQRSIYIPYRDSVLTWLLKDSLGGNSKTMMVSTISPASSYYNETISTLRYSQRAKSIVNKPRVNEDLNVATIRKLRQEIAQLRSMLASAHLQETRHKDIVYIRPIKRIRHNSASEPGAPLQSQDSNSIMEVVKKSEEQANQLTQSWLEKWTESQDIMKESNMSIQRTVIGRRRSGSMGVIVDSDVPHLIGVNDDICSTGVVMYRIQDGKTTIGREDSEEEQNIVLNGPAIMQEHCILKNYHNTVVLQPINGALCTVNNEEVIKSRPLKQGDLIGIGKTHNFRFNNPAEAARLREVRMSSSDFDSNPDSLSHCGSFGSLAMLPPRVSAETVPQCSVSPFMMFNPNVEVERKCKTDPEKIEQARHELEKLRRAQEEATLQHQEKEDLLLCSHNTHKAEIERERHELQAHITTLQELKVSTQKEVKAAERDYIRQKKEYQRLLSMQQEKLRQLHEKYKLDSINEPDEDDSSDIDELGNTVVPSEQKVNNTIRRRKISVEGKVKDLAQEELLHKLSEKDTEQKLFEQSEDFEDKYSFTEQEIEKKQNNIKDLEKNYRKNDASKLHDMSTLEQHMQSLQNQKEQLVLYVEERQELMQVEEATPNPLRSAQSELTLFDSTQPVEVGFPFRTSSMSALGAEDDSLLSLSKRNSNASSSSLDNSMGSQDSINSIGEVRKKSPHRRSLNADGSLLPGYTVPSQRRRLSAPALDVTSRLYQTPNVPKVKKTEFKKAPPKPTQHREKFVARSVEVKQKEKNAPPMKFSGTPFSNKVNSLGNSEVDSQLTNKGRQFSRLSSKIKSATSLASVPEALNEETGDTASVKPDAVKMRNRTRYPGESERRHSAPVDIIANFKKLPAKPSEETDDKKKATKSAKPKRTFKSVVRNVISKCVGANVEKDQTKAKEETPKPVKVKVVKTEAKPAPKREHEKKREPFKRPGKKVKIEDIPVEIFVAPIKSPVTTVSEGCNVELALHVSTVDVVVHEQFSDDSLNGDDKDHTVMADSLETDDIYGSGPQVPETKSQGVSTSQEELALSTNDPFNVCASDSLADAQQKLQLLQQALSQLSEKAPRRPPRKRVTKKKGSDSDGSGMFSDDSLASDVGSKPSSRPGSGSRRRRKAPSKLNEAGAKKPRGHSSAEEYSPSDTDGVYSDDSLAALSDHARDLPGNAETAKEISTLNKSIRELTDALSGSPTEFRLLAPTSRDMTMQLEDFATRYLEDTYPSEILINIPGNNDLIDAVTQTSPGLSAEDAKEPIKYEVTINQDETNVLYNMERTEYKTFALRKGNSQTDISHTGSIVSIPESLNLNITETKIIRNEDFYETRRTEEVNFNFPQDGSEIMEGECIVKEKSYASSLSNDYERVMQNSRVSREGSSDRSVINENSSSYTQPVNSRVHPYLSSRSKRMTSTGTQSGRALDDELWDIHMRSVGCETTNDDRLETGSTSDYGTVTPGPPESLEEAENSADHQHISSRINIPIQHEIAEGDMLRLIDPESRNIRNIHGSFDDSLIVPKRTENVQAWCENNVYLRDGMECTESETSSGEILRENCQTPINFNSDEQTVPVFQNTTFKSNRNLNLQPSVAEMAATVDSQLDSYIKQEDYIPDNSLSLTFAKTHSSELIEDERAYLDREMPDRSEISHYVTPATPQRSLERTKIVIVSVQPEEDLDLQPSKLEKSESHRGRETNGSTHQGHDVGPGLHTSLIQTVMPQRQDAERRQNTELEIWDEERVDNNLDDPYMVDSEYNVRITESEQHSSMMNAEMRIIVQRSIHQHDRSHPEDPVADTSSFNQNRSKKDSTERQQTDDKTKRSKQKTVDEQFDQENRSVTGQETNRKTLKSDDHDDEQLRTSTEINEYQIAINDHGNSSAGTINGHDESQVLKPENNENMDEFRSVTEIHEFNVSVNAEQHSVQGFSLRSNQDSRFKPAENIHEPLRSSTEVIEHSISHNDGVRSHPNERLKGGDSRKHGDNEDAEYRSDVREYSISNKNPAQSQQQRMKRSDNADNEEYRSSTEIHEFSVRKSDSSNQNSQPRNKVTEREMQPVKKANEDEEFRSVTEVSEYQIRRKTDVDQSIKSQQEDDRSKSRRTKHDGKTRKEEEEWRYDNEEVEFKLVTQVEDRHVTNLQHPITDLQKNVVNVKPDNSNIKSKNMNQDRDFDQRGPNVEPRVIEQTTNTTELQEFTIIVKNNEITRIPIGQKQKICNTPSRVSNNEVTCAEESSIIIETTSNTQHKENTQINVIVNEGSSDFGLRKHSINEQQALEVSLTNDEKQKLAAKSLAVSDYITMEVVPDPVVDCTGPVRGLTVSSNVEQLAKEKVAKMAKEIAEALDGKYTPEYLLERVHTSDVHLMQSQENASEDGSYLIVEARSLVKNVREDTEAPGESVCSAMSQSPLAHREATTDMHVKTTKFGQSTLHRNLNEHDVENSDSDSGTGSMVSGMSNDTLQYSSSGGRRFPLKNVTPANTIAHQQNDSLADNLKEENAKDVLQIQQLEVTAGSDRKVDESDSSDDTFVSSGNVRSVTGSDSSLDRTPKSSPRQPQQDQSLRSEYHAHTVEIRGEESSSLYAPMTVTIPQPVYSSTVPSNTVSKISSSIDRSKTGALVTKPKMVSSMRTHGTTALDEKVLQAALRKELEKRIAGLQNHIKRSLSDSAISSDFTDVESTTVSPRSSRLYDHEKTLVDLLSLSYQLQGKPTPMTVNYAVDALLHAAESLNVNIPGRSLDAKEGLRESKQKMLRLASSANLEDIRREKEMMLSVGDCYESGVGLDSISDKQALAKSAVHDPKNLYTSVYGTSMPNVSSASYQFLKGHLPETLRDVVMALKPVPLPRSLSLDSISLLIGDTNTWDGDFSMKRAFSIESLASKVPSSHNEKVTDQEQNSTNEGRIAASPLPRSDDNAMDQQAVDIGQGVLAHAHHPTGKSLQLPYGSDQIKESTDSDQAMARNIPQHMVDYKEGNEESRGGDELEMDMDEGSTVCSHQTFRKEKWNGNQKTIVDSPPSISQQTHGGEQMKPDLDIMAAHDGYIGHGALAQSHQPSGISYSKFESFPKPVDDRAIVTKIKDRNIMDYGQSVVMNSNQPLGKSDDRRIRQDEETNFQVNDQNITPEQAATVAMNAKNRDAQLKAATVITRNQQVNDVPSFHPSENINATNVPNIRTKSALSDLKSNREVVDEDMKVTYVPHSSQDIEDRYEITVSSGVINSNQPLGKSDDRRIRQDEETNFQVNDQNITPEQAATVAMNAKNRDAQLKAATVITRNQQVNDVPSFHPSENINATNVPNIRTKSALSDLKSNREVVDEDMKVTYVPHSSQDIEDRYEITVSSGVINSNQPLGKSDDRRIRQDEETNFQVNDQNITPEQAATVAMNAKNRDAQLKAATVITRNQQVNDVPSFHPSENINATNVPNIRTKSALSDLKSNREVVDEDMKVTYVPHSSQDIEDRYEITVSSGVINSNQPLGNSDDRRIRQDEETNFQVNDQNITPEQAATVAMNAKNRDAQLKAATVITRNQQVNDVPSFHPSENINATNVPNIRTKSALSDLKSNRQVVDEDMKVTYVPRSSQDIEDRYEITVSSGVINSNQPLGNSDDRRIRQDEETNFQVNDQNITPEQAATVAMNAKNRDAQLKAATVITRNQQVNDVPSFQPSENINATNVPNIRTKSALSDLKSNREVVDEDMKVTYVPRSSQDIEDRYEVTVSGHQPTGSSRNRKSVDETQEIKSAVSRTAKLEKASAEGDINMQVDKKLVTSLSSPRKPNEHNTRERIDGNLPLGQQRALTSKSYSMTAIGSDMQPSCYMQKSVSTSDLDQMGDGQVNRSTSCDSITFVFMDPNCDLDHYRFRGSEESSHSSESPVWDSDSDLQTYVPFPERSVSLDNLQKLTVPKLSKQHSHSTGFLDSNRALPFDDNEQIFPPPVAYEESGPIDEMGRRNFSGQAPSVSIEFKLKLIRDISTEMSDDMMPKRSRKSQSLNNSKTSWSSIENDPDLAPFYYRKQRTSLPNTLMDASVGTNGYLPLKSGQDQSVMTNRQMISRGTQVSQLDSATQTGKSLRSRSSELHHSKKHDINSPLSDITSLMHQTTNLVKDFKQNLLGSQDGGSLSAMPRNVQDALVKRLRGYASQTAESMSRLCMATQTPPATKSISTQHSPKDSSSQTVSSLPNLSHFVKNQGQATKIVASQGSQTDIRTSRESLSSRKPSGKAANIENFDVERREFSRGEIEALKKEHAQMMALLKRMEDEKAARDARKLQRKSASNSRIDEIARSRGSQTFEPEKITRDFARSTRATSTMDLRSNINVKYLTHQDLLATKLSARNSSSDVADSMKQRSVSATPRSSRESMASQTNLHQNAENDDSRSRNKRRDGGNRKILVSRGSQGEEIIQRKATSVSAAAPSGRNEDVTRIMNRYLSPTRQRSHRMDDDRKDKKSGVNEDTLRDEIDKLQQERVEILDLLSLNYLPSSLTIELLEAKLNYCLGQTDMLLQSLEEARTDDEVYNILSGGNVCDIDREYLSQYITELQQSKKDIEEQRDVIHERQRSAGRGRTMSRNRDIWQIRRKAEIEAFQLERLREQRQHELGLHISSSSNSGIFSDRADDRTKSSSNRWQSYKPWFSTKQHKDHLVTLRKNIISSSEKEKNYRPMTATIHYHSRSVSPDRQPLSSLSHYSDRLSRGLTLDVTTSAYGSDWSMTSASTMPRNTSVERMGIRSYSTPILRESSMQSRGPYTGPLDTASVSESIHSETAQILDQYSQARVRAEAEIQKARDLLMTRTSSYRSPTRKAVIGPRYSSVPTQMRPDSLSRERVTSNNNEVDGDLDSRRRRYTSSADRPAHTSSSNKEAARTVYIPITRTTSSSDNQLVRQNSQSYSSYPSYANSIINESERRIENRAQRDYPVRTVYHSNLDSNIMRVSSPSSMSNISDCSYPASQTSTAHDRSLYHYDLPQGGSLDLTVDREVTTTQEVKVHKM